MLTAHDALGADGALARNIPGFRPRAQQQEMADAVARCLADRTQLIAEAGTGTGKTYAYLVPALLAGGKVIVSTGTKALQEQIYHRDLPLVRDALQTGGRIALLKGRANYLCAHRLGLAELEGRFATREQTAQLQRVLAWAEGTRTGDIAEVTDIPEDASIWPWVTSTSDNCLGQECPKLGECHVMQARRAAQEADVLVINHHLLCADMAIREGGFGEVLPGADAFIIDEAHQLADIATQFFGLSVSSRQLTELARDSIAEHTREAGDMADIPAAAAALEAAVREFRQALPSEPRRGPWREQSGRQTVCVALARVQAALSELQTVLELAASRGKGLENCHARAQALMPRLQELSGAANDDYVHWYETYIHAWVLHHTPLDIAGPLKQSMERLPAAWVFTSATLTVNGEFNHYVRRLGLFEAETTRWDSPFDYPRQAVLYVPKGVPDPADPTYTASVVEAAWSAIQESRGRAFLLFTSHRALQEAARLLEGRREYPLLVQGTLQRSELLRRFRELGNAVLLGTGSFWEGVDVKGPTLSLVVIDKLPFGMPDDPVLAARIDASREGGGNPFMEIQLPAAVISLKQGAGRLIRDQDDRGVMMLCDPRLTTKSYGRVFLNSLPPMTRTREISVVQRFFAIERARASQAE